MSGQMYRAKRRQLQARQYTDDHDASNFLLDWPDLPGYALGDPRKGGALTLAVGDGTHVDPGEWVVMTKSGQVHVFSEEAFEEFFEALTEPPEAGADNPPENEKEDNDE